MSQQQKKEEEWKKKEERRADGADLRQLLMGNDKKTKERQRHSRAGDLWEMKEKMAEKEEEKANREEEERDRQLVAGTERAASRADNRGDEEKRRVLQRLYLLREREKSFIFCLLEYFSHPLTPSMSLLLF